MFQKQLEKDLVNHGSDIHPELASHDIQKAVETAMISTSSLNQKARKNQWISTASAELTDSQKFITFGSGQNEGQRRLKRRLIKSLCNDREQW